MTRVVLIGGGEHARVVVELLHDLGDVFEVLGFVDPEPCAEMVERFGVPRLGDDGALSPSLHAMALLGVGAIGSPAIRRRLVSRLNPIVEGWVHAVHRRAAVSATARIAEGAVVMAGAVVQTGAFIGAHAVVNTGAIVEHDVHVGAFAQVAPGATVGGGARIEDGAYIGLGAVVRDHRTVGKDAVVAMGAVVIEDVPAGARVQGVPARMVAGPVRQG